MQLWREVGGFCYGLYVSFPIGLCMSISHRFMYVSLASEYLFELVILLVCVRVCVCARLCCFLVCQDLTLCPNISCAALGEPALKVTVPSL